jgi:membrane associated rhomboid family serine protease
MLNLVLPLIFLIGLLPVLPAWSVAVLFYLGDVLQALFGLDTRSGGTAVAAHLGGLAAGLLLVNVFVGSRGGGGKSSSIGSVRPQPGPVGARWRRRPRKPD